VAISECNHQIPQAFLYHFCLRDFCQKCGGLFASYASALSRSSISACGISSFFALASFFSGDLFSDN
jgi:hypothetical protein